MFESLCVRQQNYYGENPLDMGFLAEALLFYERVYVIADNPTVLKQLIVRCGIDNLFALSEANHLKVAYLENGLGIETQNHDTSYERHKPVVYRLPRLELQHVVPKLLTEVTGRSGKGRRLARRLIKLVQATGYESSIVDSVLEDFADTHYIRDAIVCLLKSLTPEYGNLEDVVFRLFRDGSGFIIETNIDFVRANASYHRRVSPTHSSLSASYLLSRLCNIREDLYFSSLYSSDIATEVNNSMIHSLKFGDLLGKRRKSGEQISCFQDFEFNDARAIRGAINSGQRDFTDVRNLLSKAAKFRHWLKDQSLDTTLVKAYFREATQSSWVDHLPSKTVRWLIFTGGGLLTDALIASPGIGTVAGVALSAMDGFLLDKLIKGWKPNQFVQEALKEFVDKKRTSD